MSNRNAYLRPLGQWWLRDAYFVQYMAREVTAFFVAAYAIVLLVGLVRLGQGEAAYNAWLQALKTPASLVCHLILLAVFVYHSLSWLTIMPITLPMMFVGDKRVEPRTIIAIGITTAVVLCLAVFFIIKAMNS